MCRFFFVFEEVNRGNFIFFSLQFSPVSNPSLSLASVLVISPMSSSHYSFHLHSILHYHKLQVLLSLQCLLLITVFICIQSFIIISFSSCYLSNVFFSLQFSSVSNPSLS
uniref:Uncharacterized protein n=1 Tax=Cacopsylla melanoneura TaxID=428564 RepID=A0A8D8S4C7_9HEMI